MNKLWLVFSLATVVMATAFWGCISKNKQVSESPSAEFAQEAVVMQEAVPEAPALRQTVTPQLTTPEMPVQTEALPATAALEPLDKNREIQTALKNAGFYTGAIDGIIGPQTKRAIEEFQRTKGLKVDGIVGPKTMAELAIYLNQ